MFEGLRWRLLLSYLSVMAAILSVFGLGVYGFFTRNLERQLNAKLQTLAQSAAPSLAQVQEQGTTYLDEVAELPWRDIFNRNAQSLEWFDANGSLLAAKGKLTIDQSLEIGPRTYGKRRAKTYTISVHSSAPNAPESELLGYIRASQSTRELRKNQQDLLWGLAMGGSMALGLVTVGGLWLTHRSLQPIEESFQRLKQFTADASHELRSPLTVISTSIGVMIKHPERIDPKDTKKIHAIAGATTQMRRLVEDLLFLARSDADSGADLRANEWMLVSLDKLLKEQVEFIELQGEAKNLTITTEGLKPLWVQGDPGLLSRLFSNLMRNAVQYTPPGGRITLSLTRQYQMAVVTVQDTGIGIAPDQLQLIFNRFWRADRARSRRSGGVGLGLAISQSIVKRHRGRITIQSRLGEGSSFRVYLPLSNRSLVDSISKGARLNLPRPKTTADLE